jgi:hypothetical protein
VPIDSGMKNLAQNTLDALANLWDSLAFRVILGAVVLGAVPAAFLAHVSATLAN